MGNDKLYKISCCYADSVYNSMLSKRYGIGFCNEGDLSYIEELKDIIYLYNEYLETSDSVENVFCSVTKMEEYINLI
jgi:hypothetical protein